MKSIYDGRDLIGTIIERNGAVDVFDVHGVHLGTYPKLKAAVSAVNASLPRTCVCDSSAARRDNSSGD